jgi:hypothetical protein
VVSADWPLVLRGSITRKYALNGCHMAAVVKQPQACVVVNIIICALPGLSHVLTASRVVSWSSPNASMAQYLTRPYASFLTLPTSFLHEMASARSVPSVLVLNMRLSGTVAAQVRAAPCVLGMLENLELSRLPHTTSPQIVVSVNRGPVGGSVNASPSSGTALMTNFTVRASGWTDPEGDLPLTYMWVDMP